MQDLECYNCPHDEPDCNKCPIGKAAMKLAKERSMVCIPVGVARTAFFECSRGRAHEAADCLDKAIRRVETS